MSIYDNYGKDSQVKCNVVLIGKTGAGKSSFANYLFESDKFKTSLGRRGTDWHDNFQQNTVDYSGVRVNVFDSVGLEEHIINPWKDEFKTFLDKKCNKTDAVLKADELLHIIFYVINASSGRAEDLIAFKDLLHKYDIPVTVILTNCDIASQEKKEGIKEVCFNNGFTDVIEVCSVKKRTRMGSSEPFGREEALARVIDASAVKVGKELTLAVLDGLIKKFSEIKTTLISEIENSNLSIFNLDSLENLNADELLSDFDNLEIDDLIPNYYRNYINFIDSIDTPSDTSIAFDNLFTKLDNFLDNFDLEKMSFYKEMDAKVKALDDDEVSVIGKAWALLSLGYRIIRIKTTIEECIEEMFSHLCTNIREIKYEFEKERVWEQIGKRQDNAKLNRNKDNSEVAQTEVTNGVSKMVKDAESGDVVAMFNLGQVFEYGRMGKKIDYYAARNWYRKAAKNGFVSAQYKAEDIERKIKEEERKTDILKRFEVDKEAAERLYNEAWRYEHGIDVPEDIERAKELYRISALKGSQNAKSRLNFLTRIS